MEAAQILGISDKRVYGYVDEGRLTSLWAADVIMIPLDEVKTFKRRGVLRGKGFFRINWRYINRVSLQL